MKCLIPVMIRRKVYDFFETARQRFYYHFLIGATLLSAALWETNFLTGLAVVLAATVAAISRKGNAFIRLSWVLLPLLAFASIFWLNPFLGAVVATITAISLWGLVLPTWKKATLIFGAFLLFLNILIFSVAFSELAILVFIFGGISLFVLTGAGTATLSGSGLILTVLTLSFIQMQLIMLLRFLPYGYFTLAAIATIWHFVLISATEFYLNDKAWIKKVAPEVLTALVLTLIAVLLSGVSPR